MGTIMLYALNKLCLREVGNPHIFILSLEGSCFHDDNTSHVYVQFAHVCLVATWRMKVVNLTSNERNATQVMFHCFSGLCPEV